MCWLSGSLTCRIPNVMRSPPAKISLVSSVTVDWCLAPRRWGFYLKSRSPNYPDHGHHGDPPPKRKIPMVEPGIKPGTSWLVVRSSDHEAGRAYVNAVINLRVTYKAENFLTSWEPVSSARRTLLYGVRSRVVCPHRCNVRTIMQRWKTSPRNLCFLQRTCEICMKISS